MLFRSLPVLDFRGDEVDALMGFLGKPKMDDAILVCGPQSVLVPALEGIACLHEITLLAPMICSKLEDLEAGTPGYDSADFEKIRLKLSKTLIIAEKLGLAFVHVPIEAASHAVTPMTRAS